MKYLNKKNENRVTASDIARTLESGEAKKIGVKAQNGNGLAMKVITTYVLWQRFVTEKTEKDFERAYKSYKLAEHRRRAKR